MLHQQQLNVKHFIFMNAAIQTFFHGKILFAIGILSLRILNYIGWFEQQQWLNNSSAIWNMFLSMHV